MLKPSSLAKWGAAVLLLSSLSSCEDVLEQYFPKPTPPPTSFPDLGLDIPFYTLAGGTRLDAFSTKSPATRSSSVSITGLQNGETLLAIDFRPATGQLYGVSSASRIYVVNQKTGAAHAIGTGPFTPAVQGNLVGFDFNPTVDRIRLVTNTGQNLRLNPETGTVAATDGSLNGVAGAQVTGAAYTNNTAGASTTALYALNAQNQQLYLVNPPNDGTLVPVGNLNLNISGEGGFDIDDKTGTALGLYSVNGKPTLFSVNLSTGAARPLAEYAANSKYSGIAIPTRPVVYAISSTFRGAPGVDNTLHIFNPTNPTEMIDKPIVGLSGFPSLYVIGLDFRPANGQLYVLTGLRAPTNINQLYTIDLASGAATLVARLSMASGGNTDLLGAFRENVGFDFNPAVDRIRIVSSLGQNLRVNPTDGVAIVDESLNPGNPSVNAVAYSNNFVGTMATDLYAIDNRTDKLYLQNPPNAGTLTEIGDLGIGDIVDADFDIGGTSNTAFALVRVAATSTSTSTTRLYTINKSTGAATAISEPIRRPNTSGLAIGLGF